MFTVQVWKVRIFQSFLNFRVMQETHVFKLKSD